MLLVVGMLLRVVVGFRLMLPGAVGLGRPRALLVRVVLRVVRCFQVPVLRVPVLLVVVVWLVVGCRWVVWALVAVQARRRSVLVVAGSTGSLVWSSSPCRVRWIPVPLRVRGMLLRAGWLRCPRMQRMIVGDGRWFAVASGRASGSVRCGRGCGGGFLAAVGRRTRGNCCPDDGRLW